MNYAERVMLGLLLSAAVLTLGSSLATGRAESPQPKPQSNSGAKASRPMPDRGQQVFNQNCSRCHSQPEGFSPSEAGAVARHMRVRANLSEEDYKALLHFLNP
jgi:cytochrome c5